MSPSPAMMRWAAVAMVCRPDEQKRLMVMPAVVTGQPPRSAIWRAMLAPVAPSGIGAADEHVFDFARLDAGARDGRLQHMAAQRGAVGHVEGAFPRFGQGGAGGRYDDGVNHESLLMSR
jgi:hypothetical protein